MVYRNKSSRAGVSGSKNLKEEEEMKRIWVAAFAALVLAGCFSAGPRTFRPFTMPDGERGTVVGYDQKVPEWMVADSERKMGYVVKSSIVTPRQEAAMNVAEEVCRLYVGDVHPSNVVAVGTEAVGYALLTAAGVAAGSQALSGSVSALEYFQYGAGAGGGPGLFNALIKLGGKSYTLHACGAGVFDTFPRYGIRVVPKSPW